MKINTLEKDIECFTHSLSIEEGNIEDKKNIKEHSKYLKKGK